MTGAVRPVLVAAVLVTAAVGPARAADTFAWTPANAPAVVRGREVASRFDMLWLLEITVEVDNAFDAANREGLALAEQRMSEIPGMRRVIGPSRLLEVSLDAAGQAAARPMLARGAGASRGGDAAASAATLPGSSYDADGEAARQRVVRRADALGWFLSTNGRLARFLIDADDYARVRPGIEAALVASGLGMLRPPSSGGVVARPLWPDPRGHGARWLPAALSAGWVLFVVLAGIWLWPGPFRLGLLSAPRAAGVVLAATAGAAALFLPVAVAGVRSAGVRAGAAAAAVVLLALEIEGRFAPRRYDWHRPGRPPALLALLSLILVAGAAALSPRVRVGTHQWDEAPLTFVSVRGDLDQPVVLRELRRLTDFLRAQPGVANAWSVADLFQGVQAAGEEASRIPDEADQVRRVLVQARNDPAVRLELSADHREALIGVRFDSDVPSVRLELADSLALYLATELRTVLVAVDLRDPRLAPAARTFARGLLGVDTRERVARICTRSGRGLSAAEGLAVEQAARQAALIPSVDRGRLETELSAELRAFAPVPPFPLSAADGERLALALAGLPDDAGAAGVRPLLAATAGAPRLAAPALDAAADGLARRVASVRRRHIARLNFKEMLYGADLPTEGVLADEVRSATLEGMGPIVGLPVAASQDGALVIDAAPVGGAAHDRALSEAWEGGLRAGVVGAGAAVALLLMLVAGLAGLAWLPIALAPFAVAVLPSAIFREPLGLWSLSFLAGALAAGAASAASLAARRAR